MTKLKPSKRNTVSLEFDLLVHTRFAMQPIVLASEEKFARHFFSKPALVTVQMGHERKPLIA